jgi:hypothetical protein
MDPKPWPFLAAFPLALINFERRAWSDARKARFRASKLPAGSREA